MANIKSLADINGENDDDDNRKHNDYYAGGEKSGQLIRGAPEDEDDSDDEDDRVGAIFQKAKAVGARQGTSDDLPGQGQQQRFQGQGRTLAGSSGAGPSAQQAAGGSGGGGAAAETSHVVKFYRNGVFTVDDGPARGVEDPSNLDFIAAVTRGECPRELDPGDADTPVTVNLLRVEEDYVPPKYVAFGGQGRTLAAGGGGGGGGGAGSSAAAAAAAAAAAPAPPGEWEGVDESQPTTSIQVRLADGSRMVARMNAGHTIADIRRFIRASRPDVAPGYALVAGFPPAPLGDESRTLEAAGLLNAVIQQRAA